MVRVLGERYTHVILWASFQKVGCVTHRKVNVPVQIVRARTLPKGALLRRSSIQRQAVVGASASGVTAGLSNAAISPFCKGPLRTILAGVTILCTLLKAFSTAETAEKKHLSVGRLDLTIYVSLPSVTSADAVAVVDIATSDTRAAGDSPAETSNFMQHVARSLSHVLARNPASSQVAAEETDSHSTHEATEQGGEETGKRSRNGEQPTSDEKNTGSAPVTPGDSGQNDCPASKTDEDDIFSFLQVALGAAVVLAGSTWLLLEQRKALTRARYDRLTDLLQT